MRLRLILAAFLLLLAGASHAACVLLTVSTPGLNFGAYNLTEMTANGVITLNCRGASRNPYTIALSTGDSGTYAQRRMHSGSHTLAYNLYTNESHTQIWGDGTGGSTDVSGSMDIEAGHPDRSVSYTVYGHVPNPPLRPAAGNYTDSIMITIIY